MLTTLKLTRPLFTTTTTTTPPPPLRRISAVRMSTTITTPQQLVEHIVLFKVKPTADPTLMLSSLNGLRSLDSVLHLTAGPIHKAQPTSSPLHFTHLLHSRYPSKPSLAQYSAHPAHLDAVRAHVLPICDDIMAVDWVSHSPVGPTIRPGSALRVQLIKPKEGLSDQERDTIFGVISGLKEKVEALEEMSFGVNFSPERAKGFSIASVGVFPRGIEALESGVGASAGVVEGEKEKVRGFIDELLVFDYVVPKSGSSL